LILIIVVFPDPTHVRILTVGFELCYGKRKTNKKLKVRFTHLKAFDDVVFNDVVLFWMFW